MNSRVNILRFFLIACFAMSPSLRGELIISEFLANNRSGITDEDGFPADWIEIYNPDRNAVSLRGYALTDDPERLNKWLFPEMTIMAGGHLRIFATDKDRTTDSTQLHTNFKLRAQGEYLALVKSEGSEVAYDFGSAYPPQLEDISYGPRVRVSKTFLSIGADVTYLVPSEDIGAGWLLSGFDDSSWTSAQSAVGFNYSGEVGSLIGENADTEQVMKGINGSLYLRFPFQVEDPAAVKSLLLKTKVDDGFVAYLNGHEVGSKNRPDNVTWNSVATNDEEVGPDDPYESNLLDFNQKLIQGENILAVHVLNSRINSGDLIFASELEATFENPILPFQQGYFENPTPGSPNGIFGHALPSLVGFNVTSRAFREDFQVTLSAEEAGATIRYTTDGTLPDLEALVYENPIPITSSILIRTRAYLPGSIPGLVRSEGYVKISASEADFSSDLPVVILTTFGNGSPHGTSSTTNKEVFMLIYEPDRLTGRSTLEGSPTLATRGGFRIRGSSSSLFPKYPLALESWDENNRDSGMAPT